MRLGELKKILDKATDDNWILVFDVEDLYGGQRFKIKGFSDLITALNQLIKLSWVEKFDDEEKNNFKFIESYYNTYRQYQTLETSPEQKNILNTIINNINTQLPLFCSILDSLVEEQDEQIINIKLPLDVTKDFAALNKFNKKLEDVFHVLIKHKGLGGDIKFKGFDIGSAWYQISITDGMTVYLAFMGILSLAHKVIKMRKEWYESENIKHHIQTQKIMLQSQTIILKNIVKNWLK